MGMSENQKAVLVTEIKPNLEKLHMYSKFKLALAGQLRIVRQAFETLGREKAGVQKFNDKACRRPVYACRVRTV